jgi:hypothetical protein
MSYDGDVADPGGLGHVLIVLLGLGFGRSLVSDSGTGARLGLFTPDDREAASSPCSCVSRVQPRTSEIKNVREATAAGASFDTGVKIQAWSRWD